MISKYLIIGNGIAGLTAAKEIRNNDKEGSITIITAEPYLTYYRIKLSKALSSEMKEDSLLVNKEQWYKDNNISVALNSVVQKIDVEKNHLYLQDGKIYEYEKLLIATGSRPFIPPIEGREKNGVLALRTISDVEIIQIDCIGCEIYTVIGAGLLGLETAWSLKEMGRKVNVIASGPYPMNRQVDEEIGNKLKEKLISHGINIYTSKKVKAIDGEDFATGVIVNDHELIKTHGVLISTGVSPNLDLVEDTPIQFNKGIKVDSHLKTNIPNIYAAGDVIELDGNVYGLWTASIEQGKVAGNNMSGGDMVYDKPKSFTSMRLGDIQVFSAGDIKNFDQVYEYIDYEKDIHHKIFVLDGKIRGVILYGDLKEMNTLKNAAINHTNMEDYLKTGLSFKLKSN
ncbi:NAD(P)/FAD-dependent oxidoreductase [Tissierella creatinini]|nr:NAD(P)/FAD-dependent oxidoreductase [Tissierella creatinini]TJX62796.1 NAD(P)/FAD-dependent oxidoreductase [Soehngenia saccharolytica]